MTPTDREWTKSSWKNFTALQQPKWPDQKEVDRVPRQSFPTPAARLCRRNQVPQVSVGKGGQGTRPSCLQGGDCSEDFSKVTAPKIRETLKVLLQMAVVLTYAGGKPVIKVGRIAGQFAKPRSSDTEMVDGVEIPSYRGDMVNRPEPSEEARIPNPKYMLKGYNMAASTLNLLRAFTRGGFATLQRVHSWNQEFVIQSPMGRSYERMAKQIEQAIKFMETIGISTDNPQINQTELFTSHEALLLEYEEAMTRVDSTSNGWYDCSGHMLWIGERTRQVDGAHVEFLRGVLNPLGIKDRSDL